jgi:hypothetical protein
MRSTTRYGSIIALVVAGLLAIAPAAMAQDSSALGGYAGAGGEAQTQVTAAPSAEPAPEGSLPFTGLDLALVASGGLVLILAGAALARLVPRKETR